MRIGLIACMYKSDVYSHYAMHLKQALESIGNEVYVISSNCTCFSGAHSLARAFSINSDELLETSEYLVKLPHVPLKTKRYRAKAFIGRILGLHSLFEKQRGKVFAQMCRESEVVHFQQVLRAFSVSSLASLSKNLGSSRRKIVVTVHEIDPLQLERPKINRVYNDVGCIIVHSSEMMKKLSSLGVREEQMRVVPYGVQILPINNYPRDRAVYYGGHHLLKGKGLDDLLTAWRSIKEAGHKIPLFIHAEATLKHIEEGKKKADLLGVGNLIQWETFVERHKLADIYQKSLFCLAPYTSGSAAFQATLAMASATPVIATRAASLPEYLGDSGIYVSKESPEQLTQAMINLLEDKKLREDIGQNLRKRAEKLYAWQEVATQIHDVYHELI